MQATVVRHDRSQSPVRQMKVIAMTTTATTQPRHTITRRLTAPFRALQHLNEELTGAGGAIAGSNRFPQPSPQAGLAEAGHVQAATGGKVLIGV
jgi:hypothetical protein